MDKNGEKTEKGSMKIGIFGGSFDPVHIEHTRLARAAIDGLGLDKLVVMPAHTPPHKPWKTLAPDEIRIEACRLAFADIPKTEISDYEIAQGGTSYTYLTCRHFRALYPTAELFWLVGTDMLRDFPTWKNTEEILQTVTLAVCARNERAEWLETERAAFFEKFGKRFAVLPYNGADVASTKIRVLAGAGMRLSEYMPEKAAEYIEKSGWYEVANAKAALALETARRSAHSIRVAQLAATRAPSLGIPERQAVTAALFHDCAKNLPDNSPYLHGFFLPTEWGKVPKEVIHQFLGAFVAEHAFGVKDKEVLAAIAYHTSARPNMSALEELTFLADMLEEERSYEGIERLRELFWQGNDLQECMRVALYETLKFLEKKGGEIYPLTKAAYEFYAENNKR